jgi:predicted GNAT family acetyltransferase
MHPIRHERVDRGGLARELVEAAASWARAEKLKILPLCSYAGAVLKRSPAHADLLE